MSKAIVDLIHLMARLRDPADGCPWDLKQDFASVVPHTLEEVYELVDAIEQGDRGQILQELGDVLFQVIFYSRLAEEEGAFSFEDVASGIVAKLLRRHPHVFPDGSLRSRRQAQAPDEVEVKQRWDALKQDERAERAQYSAMDDVPQALPALTRAMKLQKRARDVGFDWSNLDSVVAALKAEIVELEEAMADGDPHALADEMGDVLFSAVNLCRHLGLDAETVTRASGQKFERRIRFVEQRCREEGVESPPTTVNPQLDLFWNEAKTAGL